MRMSGKDGASGGYPGDSRGLFPFGSVHGHKIHHTGIRSSDELRGPRAVGTTDTERNEATGDGWH